MELFLFIKKLRHAEHKACREEPITQGSEDGQCEVKENTEQWQICMLRFVKYGA
jgi:hypothetical protein